MTRLQGSIALGTLCAVLAACSVAPSGDSRPPVEERGTATGESSQPLEREVEAEVKEEPGALPSRVSSQPAVVSLVARADDQMQAGDLGAASASLERALRIDARNARLWSRLAAVRLEQGDFWQAAGLAAKSNSLAGDNPVLQAYNWRLIARARRGEDDLAGAREAEEMADSLAARARTPGK
jgi:tetratricopeptide (TPR) repeat protein